MSYLNKILVGVLLVFIVGCANEHLEVSDNKSFQLYEFDVPAISSQPGEYEINFEFPKSEALIITGQPENIWRTKDNILTLDLDVARDNRIEKAQFHIKIKEGSEEDEYAIVTPKITANIDDEDYDLADQIKLGPENKAVFEQKIVYSVPMGPVMFYTILISVIILLTLLIYILLRSFEVIGPVSLSGRLTFNDSEISQVILNKKKDEFNLAGHMGITDVELSLRPKKLKHRSKMKKFVRLYYMNTSDAFISVKIENMGESRDAPSGEKLYNQDDIVIVVQSDGIKTRYDLTYYNPKIRK